MNDPIWLNFPLFASSQQWRIVPSPEQPQGAMKITVLWFVLAASEQVLVKKSVLVVARTELTRFPGIR